MAEALKRQGNRLFDREDFVGAERSYSAGLEEEPGNVALLSNRALSRIRLGDWDGAGQDCEAVLAQEPSHAKALARLGRVHFERGDLEAADQCYRRAAAISPQLPELKSRWRVDLALAKRGGGARHHDLDGLPAPQQHEEEAAHRAMRESTTGVSQSQLDRADMERQLGHLWKNLKPNPAFLLESSEDLLERSLEEGALRLSYASTVEEKSRESNVQRLYQVAELIVTQNDKLTPASELVHSWSDEPPSQGCQELFGTPKKTVFVWTGRLWKKRALHVYEPCLHVVKVGYFLWSDFSSICQGRTMRGNRYLAFDRGGDEGNMQVLALVFANEEEFISCEAVVRKVFKSR